MGGRSGEEQMIWTARQGKWQEKEARGKGDAARRRHKRNERSNGWDKKREGRT